MTLPNIDTAKRCKLHPYGVSLTSDISKGNVRCQASKTEFLLTKGKVKR